MTFMLIFFRTLTSTSFIDDIYVSLRSKTNIDIIARPCTIGSPNSGLAARTDRGEIGLPVKAEAKARIGEQTLSPPLGIVAAFSLVGWKIPQGPPKKNLLGADK